nr:alpha/beta fold hydrolase [Streptomyces sp. DSM 41633]
MSDSAARDRDAAESASAFAHPVVAPDRTAAYGDHPDQVIDFYAPRDGRTAAPLVVLLHGGEFGAGAELGWERAIGDLAGRYRVLAPDMLGFGESAKVIDFNDGRGMRIRHIAAFCAALGIADAHFVGNSMGAINLLVDATSDAPRLPVRSLTAICGGGEIQRNEHSAALYDYDATIDGMRRIVTALFADPAYPDDEAYVQRRYASSIAPGAWETLAAARFRRP